MKAKTPLVRRALPYIGLIVLAGIICSLIYIGVKGVQIGSGMPMYNNDQRDLNFFVSLYYFLSIVSFAIVAPLLMLFVTQITQLFTGRK